MGGNVNWCTQTTPMNQTALIQRQPTNTTHLVSEALLLVVIARLKTADGDYLTEEMSLAEIKAVGSNEQGKRMDRGRHSGKRWRVKQ